MALYERVLGITDAGDTNVPGRIPIHQFVAVMGEFARGRVTGAQAQAIVERVSGSPLTAGEAQEAQTLLGTVTGSTANKLARAKEIEDVLVIAERGRGGDPSYGTPSQVKARLGV